MSRPEETARTILLVEDDGEILAMVQMFLAEQGHEVLTASEGGAALAVLDTGRHIDLLATDIVMPGPCDGFELARRAVVMQPDLKVLYISGFPERIQQSETLRARGEFLACCIARAGIFPGGVPSA